MKSTFAFAIVCMAGAIVLLGGPERPGPSTSTKPATTRVEKKVRKDGFELTVTLKRQHLAGHPVNVAMTLTNRSKKRTVHSYERTLYRDFKITLRDAEGKPVPLTSFGKIWIGGDFSESSLKAEALLPGQSHSLTLNLSLLFDLTLPGQYRLTVGKSYDHLHSRATRLEVTAVKFTVAEPPLKSVKTGKDGHGGRST